MKKIGFIFIFSLILTGCFSGSGIGQTIKFVEPDIKDDFCGSQINFQYCKCAFHNEYCDNIGMSKKEANKYVQGEYEKWVAELRNEFALECEQAGGIRGEDKCEYCQENFSVIDDKCVSQDEIDEEKNDKNEFIADGPLTNECNIKQDEFSRDWKKYSDIDNAIPFVERSFEAKQALTAYDAMIDLMAEGFVLERDYEIEKQMQIELEEYRGALVKNLKTNLLKSFWRLSWITYSTIESGSGLGKSYASLLTSAEGVEAIGTGLKVVRGIIPGDSQLAIDTSSVTGKAKSVGADVALEAVESLGDPLKIATELFKSIANAPLPSADLTPEEIGVLKTQHLTKGVVDNLLSESRATNNERLARMKEIEEKVAALQAEVESFEAQEKERVKILLEESCRELKKQFEQNNG